MPAGYSYGLSILNSHLKSGAKIILNNNSVIEKIFWNKINKFKVSSFGGVPELYEFLKRIDFKKYVSKNLKYLSQAGGKMDERTLRYFGNICKINKIKFYVMYGQTEASPRISYLEWKYFFSKINSIGKPLKGYKLKIIKKNKEIKKPNITGEIVLYGDSVCLGYAKNLNDLKKGDVNKKVLYTGDLGFRDKEGFIYLSGRSKKIVKIFGKRYDLLEIENYLKKSNIKAKCRLEDKKISIDVIDLSIKEKIIDIIFNKFQLNKNFISVNLKKSKNFKEYY
jgi:acyl-coenzyme A synthetase/AMP-(fatty) acid ligase